MQPQAVFQTLYRASSVIALVMCSASYVAFAEDATAIHAERIGIVLEPDASTAETRIAEVLKNRILEVSTLDIGIGTETAPSAGLQVYLGIVREKGRLHDLCQRHELTLPARKDSVFPEGFAVKTVREKSANTIIAIGADARGVLYAAGETVRRLRYQQNYVELSSFDVRSAPGFRFRGFSTNQGGTMMRITSARSWTEAEMHGAVLEYAMAGGNTFYSSDEPSPFYDFLKSFDFMTVTGARPNEYLGSFPPEWKAGGREAWEGNHWVCPSIPEAHDALIKQWEENFAKRADHDVMRFYAGDPGGCTDGRCEPWGKTFVHLCEDLASLWLKHHPKSIVLIANQGVDNAGDQAILDYLNEQPRPWSYGICYGPGSNAMSPYFRDKEMRDDLFTYPGQGPVNRYLAEIFRQLPGEQHIMHYSDITHWISAQYAVPNPERNIMKAYGRRTFHARPRAMYDIFKAIMPFSEGDIIYSEGNHDEFHQYLWARLLWNTNRALDDIMLEYCTLYFGEDAAPLMVQALYQLESSLETPLADNPCIARYYTLVRDAGQKIPAWRMEKDYRWRLHMQKAALDQYNQFKLRIELDKERRVRALLEPAEKSGKHKAAVAQALDVLREPSETPEMKQLRDEAGRLGEETNERHGDRNPGYFKLDLPLRDISGLISLLEQARDAKSAKKAREFVGKAIDETASATRPGRIFW